LDFTEMIFRLWGCCLVTSICASAATVLILAMTVGNIKAKKKARLVEEDEQDATHSVDSNLHN